jgi:Leucine-rich repeat (LRR) protein
MSLTNINLAYNKIDSLMPLTNLINLTELYLQANQINDITGVSGLVNLTNLCLIRNQITDLTPLADLKNLEYLDLRDNQITDITPLSKLTATIRLLLAYNYISDWSPVEHIVNVFGRPKIKNYNNYKNGELIFEKNDVNKSDFIAALNKDDMILFKNIKKIYDDWDPLELMGFTPYDEYDSEILDIFEILKKNGGVKEFDKYFRRFYKGNLSKSSLSSFFNEIIKGIIQQLLELTKGGQK